MKPARGQTNESRRRSQVDRAVQLADNLNREFGSIPRHRMGLAGTLTVQATLTREASPADAVQIHQRSVRLLRQLCLRVPDVAADNAFLARSLREHGVTLGRLDHLEEPICSLEEAVTEHSAYLNARPDSVYSRRSMAGHLNLLADTLDRNGEAERATEVRRHANTY